MAVTQVGSISVNTKIDDKGFERSLNQIEDSLNKFEKSASKSFDSASKSASNFSSVIKAAVGAVAGISLANLAKDAILVSARYETLGNALKVAGTNAGYSAQQLATYEQAVKNAGYSALESRNAIIQLTNAQVDLSKSAELAALAQDLAVVSGGQAAETFDKLVYAIQTGNTVSLKALGINANFTESYKSLGKYATDFEKQQARVNEVLKKGGFASGQYQESLDTATGKLSVVASEISDLSIAIGEIGLDALGIGIDKWTKSLKGYNEELQALSISGRTEEIKEGLGDAFAFVANNIDIAAVALVAYIATQKLSRSAAAQATKEYINQTSELSKQHGILETLHAQLTGTTEALEGGRQAWIEENEFIKENSENLKENIKYRLELNASQIRSTLFDAYEGNEDAFSHLNTLYKERNVLLERQKFYSDSAAKATENLAKTNKSLSVAVVAAQKGISLLGAGLSRVVGLFGGPLVVGITAATAAFSYLNKVVEDNQNRFERFRKDTDETIEKTEMLSEAFKASSKVKAFEQLTDARKELSKLEKELDSLLKDAPYEVELYELNIRFDPTGTFKQAIETFKELVKQGADIEQLEEAYIKIANLTKNLSDDTTGLANNYKELVSYTRYFSELAKEIEKQKNKVEELNDTVNDNVDITKELTEATRDYSSVLDLLNNNDFPTTIEGYIKLLRDHTKETKTSKEAAKKLANEQANLALVLLKLEAAIALVNGELELFNKLSKEIEIFNKTLSEVGKDKKTTSQLNKTKDAIKSIRDEITELNRIETKRTFADELAKNLKDLEDNAKKAGVSLREIKKLQSEYETAFRGQAQREQIKLFQDLDAEIANLNGSYKELQELELSRKLKEIETSIRAVTASTEEADAAVLKFRKDYTEAFETSKTREKIKEQINVLSELRDVLPEAAEEVRRLESELLRLELIDLSGLGLPPELEEQVISIREKLLELNDGTVIAGIKRGAETFKQEWDNATTLGEKYFNEFVNTIQSISGNVIDAIFGDAKLRFDDLLKNLAKQILQFMSNQLIARFVSILGFGVSGSVGGVSGAGIYHSGGVVGAGNAPVRYVSSDVFKNAPKYHDGGVAGLAANEVPAILQRGELVLSTAQTKRLASGTSGQGVNINIINNSSNTEVTQSNSINSQGGLSIDVMINDIVRNNIANRGSVYDIISQQFNVRGSGFNR